MNELKIKVVFDTGDASVNAQKLADDVVSSAKKKIDAEKLVQRELIKSQEELDKQILSQANARAKEEAALQKALAKMEQKSAREAELDAVKQIRIAKQIDLAERQSAKEIDAFRRLNDVMNGATRVSANAATTLQALNYTVRDAPYFFKDFSLGILAVGNNLNPLIDGFIRMNKEAKAANVTLGSTLLNSLKGGGGLILGFSLLVTVIQAVTFAFAKNKSEASDTSASIKELSDKHRTLTEVLRDAEKEINNLGLDDLGRIAKTVTREIDALEKKLGDLLTTMTAFQNVKGGALFAQILGATPEEVTKITEKIIVLNSQLKQGANKLADMVIYTRQFGTSKLKDIFSDEEIKTISNKFKEMGEQSLPKIINEFTIGEKKIKITRDEALRLADAIDKIVKPDKTKAKSNRWDFILDELDAKIEEFKLRIDAEKEAKKILLDLNKELAATEYEKKLLDITYQYKELVLQIGEIEKTNGYQQELRLKALETYLDKFNKLFPAGMPSIAEPMKTLNKEKQDEETERNKYVVDDLNAALDELIRKQGDVRNLANDVGNSLYNAFIQGKKGVDEFLESLLLAIGKMLLTDLLTFGIGGALGTSGLTTIFGTTKGMVAPIAPNITPQVNISTQKLEKSIAALNANFLQQKEPVVILRGDFNYMKVTREGINPSQASLTKRNIVSVV